MEEMNTVCKVARRLDDKVICDLSNRNNDVEHQILYTLYSLLFDGKFEGNIDRTDASSR